MFRLALLLSLFTAAAPESLLHGAETSAHPRLTDGEVASEGDGWRAPQAAVIRAARWPTWDLGAARTLAGGVLQGDGNDAYVLSVSDDGVAFTDVYVFSPTTGSGLRTRSGTFEARGRYVRLRAEGGDGLYSVSELQLFETRTALWTSELGRPGRASRSSSRGRASFSPSRSRSGSSIRARRPRGWPWSASCSRRSQRPSSA